MKYSDWLEHKWELKLLWCLTAAAAAFAVAYSVVGVLSFSFSKAAVLAVSIFVTTLTRQYQAKIPETRITLAPKDILAFWGVIWLGVPGGILLGACASIASSLRRDGYKSLHLREVSTDIISISCAAAVFQIAFTYLGAFLPPIRTGNLLVPNEVIVASILMAMTHFLANTSLTLLFRKLESPQPGGLLITEIYVSAAVAHFASLAATILLFLTFHHFGIEFGLVIIPLAIIGNVAYKIHSSSLEQQTKQITEASRMHLATVEALASAIDARDQIGIGHIRRTQIYCVGIGNILGLSEDEINALRTGALLHDIGKLAVPDHILNKPGRLTPAELEKTKIHSSVGASILESVGFPYPVVPIVKYHHERWDGTGYPEQLKGRNIPLTARILNLADTYDTLRAIRPYRPAVSRDDACHFLRSGAGKQFDPRIVNIFLENLHIFEREIASQGLQYEPDAYNLSEPEIHDGPNTNYIEQIKRANREVFTLYSLARDFSSSLNMDETLSLFTKKVREFVPFDTCIVYLLEETKECATAVHVEGKNKTALHGKRVTVGEGVTGYVLKKCKTVENVDPAVDFAFSHPELRQEYHAMVSLPLIADERLIGAISLYSSELTNYQDEHLRLLETISRIAADALSNSLQHAEAEVFALTDPMTGLPNARSLQMQFDKEAARAGRSGGTFQVLVLDLDGFKAVNDTYGHKTGDKMLQEIGKVIGTQLRDYDFLARYGGDEFVALAPDIDSVNIIELCRRIEEAVNAFVLPVREDAFAGVGVSIGTASYPSQGETFDQILNAADKAMYLTKAFHKGRQSLRGQQSIASAEKKSFTTFENRESVPMPENSDSRVLEDELIVELDESHIISSAIN